jgi:hypothetical protein
MIDEKLAVPFETTVLGVPVTVERLDLNRSEQIVAIWPISRLAQAQSAPAEQQPPASSARVPRRQNAGRQANARGCARLFITGEFRSA